MDAVLENKQLTNTSAITVITGKGPWCPVKRQQKGGS